MCQQPNENTWYRRDMTESTDRAEFATRRGIFDTQGRNAKTDVDQKTQPQSEEHAVLDGHAVGRGDVILGQTRGLSKQVRRLARFDSLCDISTEC